MTRNDLAFRHDVLRTSMRGATPTRSPATLRELCIMRTVESMAQ